MRITQSMISKNLIEGLKNNREQLNESQRRISTGKKHAKISDDPESFSKAKRLSKQINQNNQYLKNASSANAWVMTTRNAIENLSTNASKLREISLQGASDDLTTSGRQALSDQIQYIIDDTMDILNQSYLGKKLFAGTKTKVENAFSVANDGSISYNGNASNINNKLSENLSLAINVSGQEVMDTNIFTIAKNLKAAMTDGSSQVKDDLDDVNSLLEDINQISTSLGYKENQIYLSQNRLDTANMNLSSLLSEAEDVDLAEAITVYNSQEIAYRAAMQTAADVLKLNIMDYLR